MYLEMVDALRCPEAHAETPLIASVSRREDRDIVAGVLGCPACLAEYPIADGLAVFGAELASRPGEPRDRYAESVEELAMRCAALLDLFDPGGIVVLGGEWGATAHVLREMTEALVLLVHPSPGVHLGNGIAGIRTGASLPLAAGAIRGIALDERTATPAMVGSAARALKSGGRLVAPNAASLPAGMAERARDDRHWVGEVEPRPSAPVQMGRSRAGSGGAG